MNGLLVLMSEATSERRKAPRKRTLKGAYIVFNNRHSVIDCTVRNLSARGALLLLPNIVGVPNEFEVCIDGTYHSAHVIWKSNTSLGVTWTE